MRDGALRRPLLSWPGTMRLFLFRSRSSRPPTTWTWRIPTPANGSYSTEPAPDGRFIAVHSLVYTDSRAAAEFLQDSTTSSTCGSVRTDCLRDLHLVRRCVGRSPPLAPPVSPRSSLQCRAPASAAHAAIRDAAVLDHLLRCVPHLGQLNQLLRPKTNVSTWTSLVPSGSS